MGLFDPAEHEPLTASGWDEARARDGIERIVAEVLEAFGLARFRGRCDPDDDAGVPQSDRSLWSGAAGPLW